MESLINRILHHSHKNISPNLDGQLLYMCADPLRKALWSVLSAYARQSKISGLTKKKRVNYG
jgi:hypothetical protein